MSRLRISGIIARTTLALLMIAAADRATAATNIVTTNTDSIPGSLRQVISNSVSGDTIIFATNLSGTTILLTNYALILDKSLTIDASALPGGIQINGNHQGSVFQARQLSGPGITNVLTALTITNGYAVGYGLDNYYGNGGGVLNNGTMTLNRCTVVGNRSQPIPYDPFFGPGGFGGGGIANFGTLTVNQCAISGNTQSGGAGSGIYNDYKLTVNGSTLSGNGDYAIANGRVCPKYCSIPNCTTILNQSTLSGNGGGVFNVATNPVFIYQSTLSGNSNWAASGVFTVTNSILAGNNGATLTNSVNNLVAATANLSPLGNYGGLLQTMPPLPNSPVIDNGSDTATNYFATDQRGLPRLASLHVDIGAVESDFPPAAALAVTQPATGIGLSVGTLNATVTQNGAVTTCYFQFGTTTNYGTNIAIPTLSTGTAAISNTFTGLAQGTDYHFRIVATNNLGGMIGNDLSFQTGVLRTVTNTNDNGPGSLRDAVGNFSVGDSIMFATNLSGQTILLTSGQITISNSFILDASALPSGLTIDGNTNGRIFQVASSNSVVLDSLAIINGSGSGIYNLGTLTMSKCTIAGNTASYGGGIYNYGTLTLNKCTITGNAASMGGGIYNEGTLTVNQSTLSTNSAARGGAIHHDSGNMALNQTTLAGNSANYGGGISIWGSTSVNQSTLSGNYATNSGGGIDMKAGVAISLFNTIVAGNTNSYGPNIYVSIGGIYTDHTSFLGGNVTNGNPLLAPLGNYGGSTATMPPLSGSPTIDNGGDSATNYFTSDQSGLPRLTGLHVDVGAVESAFPAAAPLVVTRPASGIGTNVATLNASVTPNGAVATCYFQYGATTNYGVTSTNVTLTAGTASIINTLTGLSQATIYHFRAVATNNLGTTFGDDVSFQTRDPIHLVTNTNDNGPGSLRDAIGTFVAGDSVVFATNLSGKTILLTNGQITLDKSLTLDASALPGGVTINGNTNGRIFQVAASTALVFDSLTITNGKVSGDGGGINNSGTLTLNRCTIAGNTASATGGAIRNNAALTLNTCTVAGNAASSDGGGILSGGVLTVNQSTLSGNSSATRGGGVFCLGLAVSQTFNQSTFSGNSANLGGGIYASNSAPLVNQSTLSGNFATNGAGGIHLWGSSSQMTLSNSIVAGNTNSFYPDVRWDEPFGITVSIRGVNLTNGNPLLSPLGNYGGPTLTMPPSQDSPAIDGCSLGTGFTNDQRGFARVSGLYADIGAVESSFPITTPLVVTQPAIVLGSNSATLNGVVTPHGAATTAAFQYGLTTSYGAASPDFHLTAGAASISYTATGLLPRTVYHFRALANNILGGSVGDDLTFLTGGFTNLVSNTNDNGPGSLRDAVANFIAGDNIAFATNLSGKAIWLTNGPIILAKSLTIDASPLTAGLAIDGNMNGRVFQVTNNTNISVVLDSLTIKNGKVVGDSGGGIYNGGKLTVNRCIVMGNAASFDGGGIYNVGILTVSTSTFTRNAASTNGGGIYNQGALILSQSTLSSNSAAYSGGGLYNTGNPSPSRLNQSTISGNSANTGGGIYLAYALLMDQCTVSANYATNGGGGLYNDFQLPRVTNSIFTGNFGPTSPDILWLGATLVLAQWSFNLTNGNPMLAPLGNYGGPTQTMPPLVGSPAIDGCAGGTQFTNDQRGFTRPVDGDGDTWAVADIGAVEGSVYVGGPGFLTGMKMLSNGMIQFGFPNYNGLTSTVFATTNLATPFDTWSNLGPAVETAPGSGLYQFTDPQATNNPQRFYRVRSP